MALTFQSLLGEQPRPSKLHEIAVWSLFGNKRLGSIELDVYADTVYVELREKAAKLLPHVRQATHRENRYNPRTTAPSYLQLYFAKPDQPSKFGFKAYQTFMQTKPKDVFVCWDEASIERDRNLYGPLNHNLYVLGFINKQGSLDTWPMFVVKVGRYNEERNIQYDRIFTEEFLNS